MSYSQCQTPSLREDIWQPSSGKLNTHSGSALPEAGRHGIPTMQDLQGAVDRSPNSNGRLRCKLGTTQWSSLALSSPTTFALTSTQPAVST